jgi:hypothetical protein
VVCSVHGEQRPKAGKPRPKHVATLEQAVIEMLERVPDRSGSWQQGYSQALREVLHLVQDGAAIVHHCDTIGSQLGADAARPPDDAPEAGKLGKFEGKASVFYPATCSGGPL